MSRPEWENGETFHLLRRVTQRHNALWRERLPDLTPVQYAVLLSLSHLPGADQNTIAEAAAVERTTMATVMRRMEQRGLVERSPDDTDGRRLHLHLTGTGARTLADSTPVVLAVRDDVLSVLPTAQAAALRRILASIVHPTSSGDPRREATDKETSS